MKKIPIIIDTDPGIDDAAALINAINSPSLDIKLITTVFGNVDVEKTTNNTLKIIEFMKREDIIVAKGASKAIFVKNDLDASDVHGESGMDGYDFDKPIKKIDKRVAVHAMKDIIENSDEKITIVTLGSLTNLALLISVYPYLKEKIKEVVLMGGSLSGGNTNTVAEFNIYNDPHAAKIVFDSGLEITVFSLDVTRKSLITSKGLEILKNGTKVAKMCYNLFKNYRSEGMEKGLIMHDSTTIAYLVHPDLFTFEKKYIDVAVDGVARGSFVSDYYTIRNKDKKPNVKFAKTVDSVKFEEYILSTINKKMEE